MSLSKRYIVVSADTHAGADLYDYKPYLASEFHDLFEVWARDFHDGWEQIDAVQKEGGDENLHIGSASFLSPYNWDNDKRIADTDRQGVAAEIVFPNTVPPFYPSGVFTAAAPRTEDEYRLRWAGVQAHNRWLVDFCEASPGRRAGIAQIFLNNLDDTIREVYWAKEHGLSGVLIPADHHRQLVNLYMPTLDPFWAACAETGLVVSRHGITVSEAQSAATGPAAPAIGVYEASMFSNRAVPHLMIGGVFHRHPDLKFAVTESAGSWVPPMLASLDGWFKLARQKGSIAHLFSYEAVKDMDLLPSEYFARNCYVGSFLTSADIDMRYDIGVDNMMWGSDYPHHEGTYPYTLEALRVNFSGVPEDEVRRMVGLTAANVYGLDTETLQAVADRIGPTPEQLSEPLDASEIPDHYMCPTFSEFGSHESYFSVQSG